ncbi:MAG: phospholipase D-like domain-containing protein, partial [Candidatus Sericytochromatia bacterium]
MPPTRSLSRILLAALVAIATSGCAQHIHYRIQNMPTPGAPRFLPTVASLTNSLSTRGQAVGVWGEPAAIYEARLAAIARAEKTIHFETFFMTPGARAEEFAEALVAAARRGVKVRCLPDFDGTRSLGRAYWKRLVDAGVEVRFYHPFDWFHPFLYNTRTHRKLLLVDGTYGMTGGTGVSDHWDGLVEKGPTAPWSDLEVAFTGPVVTVFEGIFAQHWTYVGGAADLGPAVFREAEEAGAPVLVTPGSPTDGDSPVRALYHTSLLAARERIWIASPYFLPDRNARDALLAAHRRGV